MTDSNKLDRRRALQLLGGAPMLPLAGSVAGLTFASGAEASWFGHHHGHHHGHHGVPARYTFNGMAAPSLADPAAMATTSVAATLTKTVGHHSETYKLGYETFFLTGETVPATGGGTIVAGGYFDINNQPIRDASSPDQRQFFSDCPDGTSLIQLKRVRSRRHGCDRIFAVVQFEYTSRSAGGESLYGKLPSPIAVLTLDQDKRTGQLSLVSYHNVDTSGVKGLWITCGASRSPWNTHLSSEEYEPDATVTNNSQLKAFSQNLFGNPDTANPYDYGHLPEVIVHPNGTGRWP